MKTNSKLWCITIIIMVTTIITLFKSRLNCISLWPTQQQFHKFIITRHHNWQGIIIGLSHSGELWRATTQNNHQQTVCCLWLINWKCISQVIVICKLKIWGAKFLLIPNVQFLSNLISTIFNEKEELYGRMGIIKSSLPSIVSNSPSTD